MNLVTQNTPKKQHYVPQFLLRNFAVENTERLFTFDKQQNKVFPTTVRDSASENGFYNIQGLDDKYTLENELGDLETLASKVIAKICLSGSISHLDENEHKILCFFTASLLLRVKRQRVFTSQVNYNIAKFARGLGLEPDTFTNFKELTKEEIEFQHINFLEEELLTFANEFGDKAIGLLSAPIDKSFIISDNPVVMFSHKPNRFNSKGTSVPAIEIFLPISKKLCITFLCMDFYYELAEKIEIIETNRAKNHELNLVDISYAQSLIQSIQTGNANVINEKHVNFVNTRQIVDSWSYIYNDNNDFDFAKRLVEKTPAISLGSIVKSGF
ncbi:DUF4238 domain-containing protein [Psychrobacter urativorans]|uniref:DUF4238 domain-containing protein n=1 Tax=Psychrobacter urativorans TaxID=45610 RepID=A0A0M4U6R0_9GAMM|nr:DUF4238 domain-containing protein [Psychrobacter urativorans]ALF59664.1 hypothetical protein AOC03_06050 [Psychrobacter urativorans]